MNGILMKLSKRLQFIADLVTAGNIVADIGTDHGFVPVYLVRSGKCPRALAVDISKGSLQKAEELTEKAGLSDLIECRLSDGFEKLLPGEADTAIISGMGGIMMSNIMEAHPEVAESFKELILSPQRDADLVRTVVTCHGFAIINDETLIDKNKEYIVIKAQKNKSD